MVPRKMRGCFTEQQLNQGESQSAVRFLVWIGVIEIWFHQTDRQILKRTVACERVTIVIAPS